MTPERWQQVARVYQSAMEQEPSTRGAYLTSVCGDDAELRREVESLLAQPSTPGLIDRPLVDGAAHTFGSATNLAPGTMIGTYRIVDLIGEGGMGQVYRAQDTKLPREVALKILPDAFVHDSDRLARFRQEAHVLASLNHPNIATIYGFEDSGAIHALVLEVVEGPTLADRIARGPLPLDEALPIARQISEALEAAHERGIIHRDLKPANIKLREDGTVKVLDFGLAKALEPSIPTARNASLSPTITSPALMTGVGVLLGTAAYMSPEQARGKTVDKRCDIWAFGCVLYEMVTGERAFKGEDITETLASVVKETPEWNRAPAALREILRACLEKDPRPRLRDIGDVWRLLDRNAAAPQRRPWLGWTVAAAAGFFVAIGVASILLHAPAPTPAQPIRFRVTYPAGTTPARSTPALSPDGRHLAFVATDNRTGQRRLWVHDFGALEPMPLDGTEGAVGSPFWLRDNQTIVFEIGRERELLIPGRLKKIASRGGPALDLADIPGMLRGGFGTADGRLILGVTNNPLLQMSSAGGTPRHLTELSQGEGSHDFPSLLPDGRHFMYMRGRGLNIGGIYIGTLDDASGAPGNPLLADATNVSYVPSSAAGHGFIVLARDDALLAVPFDETTLKTVGEPVAISQGVGRGVSDPQFALLTGSLNGAVAYQEAGLLNFRQLAWYDRHGTKVGTVGEPGVYATGALRLSPSGTQAVAAIRQQQHTELWLFDLQRGARSRLVANTGTNWAPLWSPDGSTVVYTSSQKAPVGIYRKRVGGGVEEWLVDGANSSDWSRDGRFFFFQRNNNDLWVLPDPDRPSAGKPVQITDSPANETDGRFSPDGRWFAYVTDQSGETEVYLRAFDPEQPGANRAPAMQVSIDGGSRPHWRADGEELFFEARRQVFSVPIATQPALTVGKPQMLFSLPMGSFDWDVTRDGQRFLVIAPVGDDVSPPFTVLLNWQTDLRK